MIKEYWCRSRAHARKYHKVYHRTHACCHLSYLGLVAAHGPYGYAAGAMFVLIIAGYVFSLEEA